MHFNLGGDVGNLVLAHLLVAAAHLGRRQLDVAHDGLLRQLHDHLRTHLFAEVIAHLLDGLVGVLLQFLLRADGADAAVDFLVDVVQHVGVGDLDVDAVDVGLMEVELLNGQQLGDDGIGVAVDALAALHHFAPHVLYIRLQDGLVADHPHHFVDDVVLGLQARAGKGEHETQKEVSILHFLFCFSVSRGLFPRRARKGLSSPA